MKNSLEIENAQQSQKSGHEVVMDSAVPASTHGSLARLKQRIQRNTRKYYGERAARQYLIQLQCRRRREWFELGADLDAAAKKAREIDQHLHLHGWGDTRMKFKPAFESELSDLTVGTYIDLVSQHGQLVPSTFYSYASRFRRIVSMIRGVNFAGRDKFDGRSNRSKWNMAVNKVPLSVIKPQDIMEWRDSYVARQPVGSPARTAGEHTANSSIRCGRSLFAKRVLRRVLAKCPNLALPSPLPFEGVELLSERESDFFYSSEVNAKQLIEDAFKELSGSQLVIFVLAIGAGMRRNEIDKLNPTSDHVFPRSWYPESTPPDLEKWQIPTCSPCNHKFGRIEEDLLMRMGMCLDDDALASLGIGRKIVRALDPSRGRDERDADARLKRAAKLLAELHPPRGDRPLVQATANPSGEAIGIPRDSLEKVGEKIIRGLIYIELEQYVGRDDDVVCDALPGPRDEFDLLARHYGSVLERGPGISVRWAKAPENPLYGMFHITLFGKYVLRGGVMPRNYRPPTAVPCAS